MKKLLAYCNGVSSDRKFRGNRKKATVNRPHSVEILGYGMLLTHEKAILEY
ncbi:MAG: hypothetical protein JKY52_20365 [Flavobacteriales bacterium]|nr:hypothetical protein [Flavobacteriales bacterium]